ncbi:MAG: proteasome endopeptidase complex, archaeal, beta subunit [Hyperthermus sp.]|nr:MAG: proteasome endopeptidase complex, archaeal, beta subunit [Hyperthermus sp.]
MLSYPYQSRPEPETLKPLKGTTTVGFITRDYVVLAADRRATSGYYVAHKKTKKIIKIVDYMALTTAGLVADAQVLAEWLSNHLRYHSYVAKRPLSVRAAAEYLSAILHASRLYPYIVQLLLGGFDTKPRLYNIDWFGSVTEEKYVATGSGSPIAIGVIEDQYRDDLSIDEAVKLAYRAVYAATKRDTFSGNGVDIVVIGKNIMKWYTINGEQTTKNI